MTVKPVIKKHEVAIGEQYCRMLSPRPVKLDAVYDIVSPVLYRLRIRRPVCTDRGQKTACLRALPGTVGGEQPHQLSKLIDLRHTLVTSGDDDGIVTRRILNSIVMEPVERVINQHITRGIEDLREVPFIHY